MSFLGFQTKFQTINQFKQVFLAVGFLLLCMVIKESLKKDIVKFLCKYTVAGP